jgi:hypothetical protein
MKEVETPQDKPILFEKNTKWFRSHKNDGKSGIKPDMPSIGLIKLSVFYSA